jgi:predicted DCC family thiol-disulfide oxidoreductase YuxK
VFEQRGFVFVPLRNPWLRERLSLRDGEVPEEMKLLRAGGTVVGGVAAIGTLLRAVWWLAPLGWLLALPGIRCLADLLYRWFARRRHRFGACRLPKPVNHPHPAHRAFLELP